MCRLQSSLLPCLIAGLIWTAPQRASADPDENTGVIRITDCVDAANGGLPAGAPVEEFCPDCPPAAVHGHAFGPHCHHGGCRFGRWRHGHWGHGLWGHPHHVGHHHCHWSRTAHQILDWFNPYGMCTFSPDHGFCPPAKSPIFQADVVYNKMFPNAWTGAPPAPAAPAPPPPVVYMPTDTTQLGYYYQKVPYWVPHPGMIPPPPVPSQWHVSLCDVAAPGHHPAGVVLGHAPRIAPLPVGPLPPYPLSGNPEPSGPSATPPGSEVSVPQESPAGPHQEATHDFLVPPAAVNDPPARGLERPSAQPRLLPIGRE